MMPSVPKNRLTSDWKSGGSLFIMEWSNDYSAIDIAIISGVIGSSRCQTPVAR